MKKFQFLLLDAGPIIKLFELGIWDIFIEKCEVTVSRTIVEEAQFTIQEEERIDINLNSFNNKINIIDVNLSIIQSFHDLFSQQYKADIHDGEKETLAFLNNSNDPWIVCSGDGAVFKTLGLLGKSEQGISLEEILKAIGLPNQLEWPYTKKFREKYTRIGQSDSLQERGFK